MICETCDLLKKNDSRPNIVRDWLNTLDRDPEVKGPRSHVAYVLVRRFRPNGTGYAVQRDIAERAGIDKDTVGDALRWLERHGYLIKVKQGKRGSHTDFRVRLPADEIHGPGPSIRNEIDGPSRTTTRSRRDISNTYMEQPRALPAPAGASADEHAALDDAACAGCDDPATSDGWCADNDCRKYAEGLAKLKGWTPARVLQWARDDYDAFDTEVDLVRFCRKRSCGKPFWKDNGYRGPYFCSRKCYGGEW